MSQLAKHIFAQGWICCGCTATLTCRGNAMLLLDGRSRNLEDSGIVYGRGSALLVLFPAGRSKFYLYVLKQFRKHFQ